jgi:hypothetical protein
MKPKKINPIEIEPETIAEIGDDQSVQVEGGNLSCMRTTCHGTGQYDPK